MKKSKGVFCLEGDWHSDFGRRSSVKPILDLLDQNDTRRVPHIYRDVGTSEELDFYLAKWVQKQYSRYKILYLGFHGVPRAILVGDQRKAGGVRELPSLAELLRGKCKGRLIFFSSCSVMNQDKRHLKSFLRSTGAAAMCGYSSDVDWMKSAAFELIAIREMQLNPFTVKGAHAIEDRVRGHARGLKLEFRMVINE